MDPHHLRNQNAQQLPLELIPLYQVEEQLINMGHHNAAYVVHCQAMTGMRVGEVLALRTTACPRRTWVTSVKSLGGPVRFT